MLCAIHHIKNSVICPNRLQVDCEKKRIQVGYVLSLPKLKQTILLVSAFLSVKCIYNFALQTLLEFFELRIKGSKYRLQRVESIIKISFAAAAVFRTLGGIEQGAEKSSSSNTYLYYIFNTLHLVFTTIYSQLEIL